MVELSLVLAAGGLMALVGAIVCLYWYVYFKRNFQGELLTDGPYGIVRHPFYTGFLMFALGLAIALPIYETRLLLVITLAVLYVYVPKEEEQMMQEYRKKYAEYKKKVPWRLIPYLY
ncbi:isoprenylcysteine carboxylmethyltransferase family protein [archaeon]|nr:isoprenylcysteine carboxylmethyltransferase family protein [archaeon]